jgi:hypothetical protein
MKVYEALEILAQLDPQLEVTVTFGKPKQKVEDWHDPSRDVIYDKNWWLKARKDTSWQSEPIPTLKNTWYDRVTTIAGTAASEPTNQGAGYKH